MEDFTWIGWVAIAITVLAITLYVRRKDNTRA